MSLIVFAGSANTPLAVAVAEQLGVALGPRLVYRFPDGELHVELQESVRGYDVYLIQSTSSPVEAHVLELWFLVDACRRASGREAVGARLIADLFAASGLQRLVAVDLHSAALEGFYAMPE